MALCGAGVSTCAGEPVNLTLEDGQYVMRPYKREIPAALVGEDAHSNDDVNC